LLASGALPGFPLSIIDISLSSEISTFNVPPGFTAVEACPDNSILASLLGGDVRRLTIDNAGVVTDTGETIPALLPINTACAPTGGSGVISTTGPTLEAANYPPLASTNNVPAAGSGISAIFNSQADKVYARTIDNDTVEGFAYNSVAGLIGAPLFPPIITTPTFSFVGVEQLEIHPDGSKLYVPEGTNVHVYDALTGASLGTFGNLINAAGICIAKPTDSDDDGVPDPDDLCPDTSIPESVPTKMLGTNRWALTDGDGDFDTTAPKGKGPQLSFTIQDTAGCSCEQIIENLGLGEGHSKFGCSISAMQDWIEEVGNDINHE